MKAVAGCMLFISIQAGAQGQTQWSNPYAEGKDGWAQGQMQKSGRSNPHAEGKDEWAQPSKSFSEAKDEWAQSSEMQDKSGEMFGKDTRGVNGQMGMMRPTASTQMMWPTPSTQMTRPAPQFGEMQGGQMMQMQPRPEPEVYDPAQGQAMYKQGDQMGKEGVMMQEKAGEMFGKDMGGMMPRGSSGQMGMRPAPQSGEMQGLDSEKQQWMQEAMLIKEEGRDSRMQDKEGISRMDQQWMQDKAGEMFGEEMAGMMGATMPHGSSGQMGMRPQPEPEVYDPAQGQAMYRQDDKGPGGLTIAIIAGACVVVALIAVAVGMAMVRRRQANEAAPQRSASHAMPVNVVVETDLRAAEH